MKENDFSTITELPNTMVSNIQIRRSHHRYVLATDYFEKGDSILEIACGGGQGLGILAEKAKSVVGIDIDSSNIEYCQKSYKGHSKITTLKMSADKLDFLDKSFDCIVLYEAIYYFSDIKKVFNEISRVLKKGGNLIICTANKDWPEFNPSPFSVKYYSIPELKELAKGFGYKTTFYGAFPDIKDTMKAKIVSAVKRFAVKYHLMPKTMNGKVFLKKMFLGNLEKYPAILERNMFKYIEPDCLDSDKSDYVNTAIYAVCNKE